MTGDEIDWLGLSTRQHKAHFGKSERRRKGAGPNRALARARSEAHGWFDRIWKEGHMNRSDAYLWLAVQLGWPRDDSHMGMMSATECMRVVELSRAYLGQRREEIFARRRAKAEAKKAARIARASEHSAPKLGVENDQHRQTTADNGQTGTT